MKAKTEEILVLAKTIEEKGIRVETLVVEVEKMRSELFEAERALLANPRAKLKGLITCLINGLQADAPSEVSRASYSDEGTSKATEKEEDLEADIAKHSSELETAVSRSTLLGGETISLADGELASELTGSCTECEELAATPDTIKLLNDDDSFKHPMPETPQVGAQLTSERKCLGFGDNPGHLGTSGDQETSQDIAGSPRKARAKQVWMRWEGRSKAMDLEREIEEVVKRKVRRPSDVEAEAGLYMICDGWKLTCRELAEIEEGKTVVVYLCLSSSSDDHLLSHSCLGTGMRFGTQRKFCHYRASLVHWVSLIVS